jgi:hypothetical protein
MLQQGAMERSRDELTAVVHMSPHDAREGYGHIARSLKVRDQTKYPYEFEYSRAIFWVRNCMIRYIRNSIIIIIIIIINCN